MSYKKQSIQHQNDDESDHDSMPDLEQSETASEKTSTEKTVTDSKDDCQDDNYFDSVDAVGTDEMEDPDFDDENHEKLLLKDISALPAEKQTSTRSRNWFATIFSDNENIDFEACPHISFAVLTKEICPKTKRTHLHVYVEYTKPMYRHEAQMSLGHPKCNCLPRLGTQRQVIMYCTKRRSRFPGFEPIFYGLPKKQGHRSDLDAINDAVAAGATKHELLQIGGGNVMRYLGMITLAQRVYNGHDAMDNIVIERRLRAAKAALPYANVMPPSPEEAREVAEKNFQDYLLTQEGGVPAESDLLTSLQMVGVTNVAPKTRKEMMAEAKKLKAADALKASKDTAASKKAKKEHEPPTIESIFAKIKQYKKYSATFLDRAFANVDKAFEEWKEYYQFAILNNPDAVQMGESKSYYVSHIREDIEEFFAQYITKTFENASPQPKEFDIPHGRISFLAENVYKDVYVPFFAQIGPSPAESDQSSDTSSQAGRVPSTKRASAALFASTEGLRPSSKSQLTRSNLKIFQP